MRDRSWMKLGWAGLGLVTLAAVAIGLWWWIVAPAPAPPEGAPAPAAPPAPVPPLLNIEGTRLAGADETGRRLWEIDAATLEITRDRDLVMLTGVTVRLYRDNAVQVELQAPAARYAGTSMVVELTGGVAGATPDGRSMRASAVTWSGRSRRLEATSVTLVQGGVTIRADRLAAGAGLDEVDLQGHVVVYVAP